MAGITLQLRMSGHINSLVTIMAAQTGIIKVSTSSIINISSGVASCALNTLCVSVGIIWWWVGWLAVRSDRYQGQYQANYACLGGDSHPYSSLLRNDVTDKLV
jgi:hypothetical protein